MLLGGEIPGVKGTDVSLNVLSVPTAYPHDFILVLTKNQKLLTPKAIFINKKNYISSRIKCQAVLISNSCPYLLICLVERSDTLSTKS